MADGSIVIPVEMDDKAAKAKLDGLRRDIESVIQKIRATGDKRDAISESLANARAEAQKTADAIKELKAEMSENQQYLGGVKGNIDVEEFNARQQAQKEMAYELAQLEKTQAKQDATVSGLEEKEREITKELEKQNSLLNQRQGEAGGIERNLAQQSSAATPKVTERVNKLNSSFKNTARTITGEFGSAVKNGLKSFMRLAFGVTSVIALVRKFVSIIKQGIREFAEYDSETKATMNGLKNSLSALKVSWGAAFAPVLNTVAPIIQKLIAMLTEAGNAVQRFFAALTGKGTYKRVIANNNALADSYGGAGGAAKDAEKQILGFDEITKLSEPTSGGGGGGGSNAVETVEETIDASLSALAESLRSGDARPLGELVSEALDSALTWAINKLDSVDWKASGQRAKGWVVSFLDGLKGKEIGAKIGELLSKLMTDVADWIRGFEPDEVIEAVTNFISDVIAGIDIVKLWKSLKYLVDSLTAQLPLILLESIAGTFQIIGSIFEGLGLDSIAKFFYGAADGVRAAKDTVKTEIINPYLDAEKKALGLDGSESEPEKHGKEAGEGLVAGTSTGIKDEMPSLEKAIKDDMTGVITDTVRGELGLDSGKGAFFSIGQGVIADLKFGWESKWSEFSTSVHGLWDRLKTWWGNLKLSPFNIPHPHFSWTYTEASGLLARAMRFAGLNPVLPHLNIAWYAKGGIVDGATLIGAGEAGKEAIVPLERNTEWINMVADGLIDRIAQSNRLADALTDLALPALVRGQIVPPRAVGNGGSFFSDGDIERLVSGITAALTGGEAGEQSIKLYLDGRQIAETVTRHQRHMERSYA